MHTVQDTMVNIMCRAHHRLQDTVKTACGESDPSAAVAGSLSHKQMPKDNASHLTTATFGTFKAHILYTGKYERTETKCSINRI